MSGQILATAAAEAAARKINGMLTGSLTNRLREIIHHGEVLSNPAIWAGPDATTFRNQHWPQASRNIDQLVQRLDQLGRTSQAVVDDILRAGSVGSLETAAGLIAGGLSGARLVNDLPSPPALTAPPRDVLTWWDNLSPDQQVAEIQANPGQIGRLNGIPAVARDRANRIVLNEKIVALESSGDKSGDLDHLRYLSRQLDSFDHSDPSNPDDPRPYLLNFDDQHPEHVVVAIGNPDFAVNVVTMVPGGTELKDLSDNVPWARNVLTAARHADPSQTTSVITWMDYHSASSPNGSDAFNHPQDAIAAGKPLNDFEQGLRVTHVQTPLPGMYGGLPLHMVLIGHSYGTVAVGDSSQQPDYQPPDDMIMTGSPGMGVHNALELHLPSPDSRAHLWVGAASGDQVVRNFAGAVGLGTDPAAWPAIDTEDFTTTPDAGHDDYYLDPGSTTMQNVGNIVVGKYDGVHTYRPVPPAEP